MEEIRYVYNILVGKTEGKRQLGRFRCILGNNIRIDIRETVEMCGLDASSSG
jgi:hypothetical protein